MSVTPQERSAIDSVSFKLNLEQIPAQNSHLDRANWLSRYSEHAFHFALVKVCLTSPRSIDQTFTPDRLETDACLFFSNTYL